MVQNIFFFRLGIVWSILILLGGGCVLSQKTGGKKGRPPVCVFEGQMAADEERCCPGLEKVQVDDAAVVCQAVLKG